MFYRSETSRKTSEKTKNNWNKNEKCVSKGKKVKVIIEKLDDNDIKEVLNITTKIGGRSVRSTKKNKVKEIHGNSEHIKYFNENEIKNILRLNETSTQTSLICHVCAKEFKKIHLLQAHIRRVHERVVVAKCKVCGRDFRDTSNYSSHMKIHSEVKSYICQHCGKCFAQLQGLKIHQRTHTLNYPFLCMVCGRRYRTKQHLDQHASAHSEERPFECGTCGKFFKTKLHLKAHSWIHSDKFRYYCRFCQKGFNNSSHLKLHVKNHHCNMNMVQSKLEEMKYQIKPNS